MKGYNIRKSEDHCYKWFPYVEERNLAHISHRATWWPTGHKRGWLGEGVLLCSYFYVKKHINVGLPVPSPPPGTHIQKLRQMFKCGLPRLRTTDLWTDSCTLFVRQEPHQHDSLSAAYGQWEPRHGSHLNLIGGE